MSCIGAVLQAQDLAKLTAKMHKMHATAPNLPVKASSINL